MLATRPTRITSSRFSGESRQRLIESAERRVPRNLALAVSQRGFVEQQPQQRERATERGGRCCAGLRTDRLLHSRLLGRSRCLREEAILRVGFPSEATASTARPCRVRVGSFHPNGSSRRAAGTPARRRTATQSDSTGTGRRFTNVPITSLRVARRVFEVATRTTGVPRGSTGCSSSRRTTSWTRPGSALSPAPFGDALLRPEW